MKRLSVSELTPDSSIQSLFLVQSKERKVSANGSAYLDLELRDATGAIKAKVCDHYPSLDRELILAGLVLHDIGKIEELEYAGGFRYSTRGQLVGHIVLSLEIVREKTRAIEGFPAGLANQIEHILLSHHGKLE